MNQAKVAAIMGVGSGLGAALAKICLVICGNYERQLCQNATFSQ
jgi:hypothetical protein